MGLTGFCVNCPCASCVATRAIQEQRVQLPVPAPRHPADASTCAYDRIAEQYARMGKPMPPALYLYCPCPKCSPRM